MFKRLLSVLLMLGLAAPAPQQQPGVRPVPAPAAVWVDEIGSEVGVL